MSAAAAKITAHPNYHPLMGTKHMWPTIWPRLPTTNIEAHIARSTAQREVKARLARERAEAEEEQRAVAAAREAKRIRMMAKIAMEESMLPAFFHSSGLVAWFSSLFAKSESASSSPSSSSSSSPSSSSSSSLDSTPRRAAVSTTIALLGLPADFVFSDRRRALKPVNPLPFRPTERPRTFATQHMQEVAEVVADASDEAKAERRRLREAQLARLRNDWRNRVHHHHHHMHHHLIAPQGETGVRSGAGGARSVDGATVASRPRLPTPPGIIYMEVRLVPSFAPAELLCEFYSVIQPALLFEFGIV